MFKYLLAVLLLTGCKSSIEKNIIKKINKEFVANSERDFILDLRNVTEFEWDKFYLVEDWETSDAISVIMGLKYSGSDVEDDHTRMLFVYKNQLVYEEDFKSLDHNKSTLYFHTDSNTSFYTGRKYIRNIDAKFSVKRSKIENGCNDCFFYSLTPVKY